MDEDQDLVYGVRENGDRLVVSIIDELHARVVYYTAQEQKWN